MTVPVAELGEEKVTAARGTTSAFIVARVDMVTSAALPERSRPDLLGTLIQTSTVRLLGSEARLIRETRPSTLSSGASAGLIEAESPVFNSATIESGKGALTISSLKSARLTSLLPAATNSPLY